MSLFRWLSAVVVAFVLAGTTPALAQDIPDEATRARVADWIERCWAPSDACWPVIKRIEESALGRWCRAIETYWDTARLVRDPETVLHSIEELRGRREKAKEFIEECVPVFAAALDEAGGADDGSSDAGYRAPVEPVDRVMQAVKRSNLRSGPGTTHDKVGLLDVGDEVRVTGVAGDWLRIEAPDGGDAFIYGPLLAVAAPNRVTTTAAQEPEPSSTNVAVTETVEDPDMPDATTRERVADWIERCDRPTDACWPVINQIDESALGRWCRTIGTGYRWWNPSRVLRNPERELRSITELNGRRRKAGEFLRECVPIYAAALDKAGEGDNGSRNTADVDTAIALESKCTPDSPEGSGCWQELIEQPDCHVWVGLLRRGSTPTSWTGDCNGGVAIHFGGCQGQVSDIARETGPGCGIGRTQARIMGLARGHDVLDVGLGTGSEAPARIGSVDRAQRTHDGVLDGVDSLETADPRQFQAARVPALHGGSAAETALPDTLWRHGVAPHYLVSD